MVLLRKWWPGGWGPQGRPGTGGGLPNLRVCKHLFSGGGTCSGEGRINVLPWYRPVGVAKTSSEPQGGKSRAARKGELSPRGTRTTVLTYPGSAPWGTGKAGEHGQNSGEVSGSSAWTRPSTPECGDIQGLSELRRDLWWGSPGSAGQPVVLLRTETAQLFLREKGASEAEASLGRSIGRTQCDAPSIP